MNSSDFNPNSCTKDFYQGGKSTLCVGCGHDQITGAIMTAMFQAKINPYETLKISGIGCSSKTPGYFSNRSFGFNSMHGRMAPVTTGASVVKNHFHIVGVSGDGDTASIGLGGFLHLVRRNVQMCYIVANNGVYGLTKGQFSATSELDAELKSGEKNPFGQMDICSLAIQAGAPFVARSFSGDQKQLVPLLQAAMKFPGTAVIDIISPCVTFNNHDQSHMSFKYVKEHDQVLQDIDIVEVMDHQEISYQEGDSVMVQIGVNHYVRLRKKSENYYDVHDKISALKFLEDHNNKSEILTGLLYLNPNRKTLHKALNICDKDLSQLNEQDLRLSPDQFKEVLKSL